MWPAEACIVVHLGEALGALWHVSARFQDHCGSPLVFSLSAEDEVPLDNGVQRAMVLLAADRADPVRILNRNLLLHLRLYIFVIAHDDSKRVSEMRSAGEASYSPMLAILLLLLPNVTYLPPAN